MTSARCRVFIAAVRGDVDAGPHSGRSPCLLILGRVSGSMTDPCSWGCSYKEMTGLTMKRNMDLIREILLHVEEHGSLEDFDDGDSAEFKYHVRLLAEADLLKIIVHTEMGGEIILQEIGGGSFLTCKGHDFVDAARDEGRWNEAKAVVKEKAGSISFTVFTQLLVQLAKTSLGL